MLRDDPSYRKLKVGGTGAFGSASYWLAGDHLLIVILNGYIENYRRFLFSDIQALVVRRTRLQYVYGFAFAFLAIAGMLGLLEILSAQSLRALNTGSLVGVAILALLTAVMLGLVFVNWALGPTCVVQLRTAVQTATLPHLARWRKAQNLLDALAPLVIAAQEPQPTSEPPVDSPPVEVPPTATAEAERSPSSPS